MDRSAPTRAHKFQQHGASGQLRLRIWCRRAFLRLSRSAYKSNTRLKELNLLPTLSAHSEKAMLGRVRPQVSVHMLHFQNAKAPHQSPDAGSAAPGRLTSNVSLQAGVGVVQVP